MDDNIYQKRFRRNINILQGMGIYDKWIANINMLRGYDYLDKLINIKTICHSLRFAHFINASFSWTESIEGIDFWVEIYFKTIDNEKL